MRDLATVLTTDFGIALGGWVRVYADAERDFRVEGMIYLPLNNEPPGAGASGRFDCVVAGILKMPRVLTWTA